MRRRSVLLKLLALALVPVGALSAACTKPEEGPASDLTLEKYLASTEMERDYVYMWHRYGLAESERRVAIQTEDYALEVDSKYGDIVGADVVDSEQSFTEYAFDDIPAAEMKFYLDHNGEGYLENQRRPNSTRIIDSGRNVNTMDYVYLYYQGLDSAWQGRVEYTAARTHFAINYQMFNRSSDAMADLKFTLKREGSNAADILGGRGVTLLDGDGNGFAFLKPAADSSVAIEASVDGVSFEQRGVALAKCEHAGFGVIGIPVKGNSMKMVEDYLAIEKLQVSATKDGSNLQAAFDPDRGVFVVDTEDWSVGQQTEDGRNRLERVPFEIRGDGARQVTATLNFRKVNVSFPTTGLSPVIRNPETLEPTGEPVQNTKNFHNFTTNDSFNYAAPDDPQRIFGGVWFHGYAAIDVAGTSVKREYICAYGHWGGIPAASHAQLCLIGWSANQLWDQSALGSWGENVTYDPDICLGRSMIDDVRPLYVRATHGSLQEYNWSGNVGGGDFLTYTGEEQARIINHRVTYYAQGPNLTDVRYNGYTADKKIATDIRINMGRTDDIVRNYYTLRYTFLEDVEFRQLSLFKVLTEGYADNDFAYYAYGDSEGVKAEEQDAAGTPGYRGPAQDIAGDQFWFTTYDSPSEDEQADVMYTIRSFSADLNGRHYDRPSFRLYGTSNYGKSQTSCEIGLPSAAGNTIRRGSVIEMVIEYDVLPSDVRYYYGTADYIRATQSVMGTATAAYQQVVGGTITADASVGTLKSLYPVAISAAAGGETAAEFSVAGGLGYVPIRISGLSSASGWQLQTKANGAWQDVVQSVTRGRDYYQANYDPASDSFELVFNVKNTSGLNFGVKNEYRLVRR